MRDTFIASLTSLAKHDPRVEVGGRNPDSGCRSSQAALGGADIRPASKQCGTVTDGNRLVEAQRGSPLGDLSGQLTRGATGQCREPE